MRQTPKKVRRVEEAHPTYIEVNFSDMRDVEIITVHLRDHMNIVQIRSSLQSIQEPACCFPLENQDVFVGEPSNMEGLILLLFTTD